MKKRSVFNDVCNSPYTDPGKLKSSLYNSTRSSKEFVQRFGLLKSLAVHEGCVNTITWDEKGEYILSGSDDQQISITNAHTFKLQAQYRTPHRANIFSAKWLPCTSNKKIVTCSGDGAIIYTELLPEDRRHCNLFNCSNGTTYDIITLPKDPNSFMSCSEDGSVRSYDLRMKSSCTKSHCIDSILLQLSLPVTAIAVNDIYPYQLAIGGSDNIVRTYDRRMIRTSLNDRTDVFIQRPVYIFQLPVKEERFYRITSLCYSPEGNDILVNYSSESLYLFSVNGSGTNFKLNTTIPPFEPFNLQPPAMPKIRRLRLRGDWSDTGPEARPEREGPSIGQVRPQLQSSVMQRMTNVLTRMLNDPATRAALAAGGEDMLSDESRILNPPSATGPASRTINPPPPGVNQLRIINLPSGTGNLARLLHHPLDINNESRIINPPPEIPTTSSIINPSPVVNAVNGEHTNAVANNHDNTEHIRLGNMRPHTNSEQSSETKSSSGEESSCTTDLSSREEPIARGEPSTSVGSSAKLQLSLRDQSSSAREESLTTEQTLSIKQSSSKEQPITREVPHHSEKPNNSPVVMSEADTQRPFKHARRRKSAVLRPPENSANSGAEPSTSTEKVQLLREDSSSRRELSSNEQLPIAKSEKTSNNNEGSVVRPIHSHTVSLERDIELNTGASGDIGRSVMATATASTSIQPSIPSNEPTASTSSESHRQARENVSRSTENSTSPHLPQVRYYPFNTIPDGVELHDNVNINIYVTNVFNDVSTQRQGEQSVPTQPPRAAGVEQTARINASESLPFPPTFRPSRNKGRGLDYIDYTNVKEANVRQKFSGHRNTRTLIKKASFYGEDFIMSGSDCGHVFIWDRHTGELVKLLQADQHVVNCVQPHPYLPLLATSGIDYDVKLWAPIAENADYDEESIKTLLSRNSLMMEETRDTVTVPASFMIRMLSCIHSLRSGARQPRRRHEGNDDASN